MKVTKKEKNVLVKALQVSGLVVLFGLAVYSNSASASDGRFHINEPVAVKCKVNIHNVCVPNWVKERFPNVEFNSITAVGIHWEMVGTGVKLPEYTKTWSKHSNNSIPLMSFNTSDPVPVDAPTEPPVTEAEDEDITFNGPF